MDSATVAVAAIRELMTLEPDREPDVVRVSPRITSLCATAVGQILVVRHVRGDSASFVAGRGSVAIHFQVSHTARVTGRVVGNGTDMRFDSLTAAGDGALQWKLLDPNGAPLPAGRYQIIVQAVEGREQLEASMWFTVRSRSVDTVAHMLTLPGNPERPEFEPPRRDWTPLGLSTLYTGIATGLTLALSGGKVGTTVPRELPLAGVTAISVGLGLSLRA